MFFFFPIINLSHSYQTPNVTAGFPELLVKITFAFGKLNLQASVFSVAPCGFCEASLCTFLTASHLFYVLKPGACAEPPDCCSCTHHPSLDGERVYMPPVISVACANYKGKWWELPKLESLCLCYLITVQIV